MNILDQLEQVVEKLGRPGVLGLPGRRIEKRATQELSGYFKSLKVQDLAKIVEGQDSKEMGKHIAAAQLQNIVRKARPALQLILKSNLHDAILAARKLEYAKEADQPFTKKGETLFDAVEWAEKQAADLVTGLDETTIDLLSDAVATGIEDQLGVQGTGRLLRDAIDGMSVSRAAMIASTEINRAMSTAAMEQLDNNGVEYKQIILSPEACPICEANAEQDPLPVDEDYDSGDSFPPFHPNCRCAITAARGPEEDQ